MRGSSGGTEVDFLAKAYSLPCSQNKILTFKSYSTNPKIALSNNFKDHLYVISSLYTCIIMYKLKFRTFQRERTKIVVYLSYAGCIGYVCTGDFMSERFYCSL